MVLLQQMDTALELRTQHKLLVLFALHNMPKAFEFAKLLQSTAIVLPGSLLAGLPNLQHL